MKILITGNKGFVGTETQKLLEANGHEVFGYDIMDSRDMSADGPALRGPFPSIPLTSAADVADRLFGSTGVALSGG